MQTQVFEIPTPQSIFEQIWAKKSNLSVLPENWHTQYLGDVGSYFNIKT